MFRLKHFEKYSRIFFRIFEIREYFQNYKKLMDILILVEIRRHEKFTAIFITNQKRIFV